MLVAKLNDDAILAHRAERGDDYRCPECDDAVILKRGAQRIAHYAHQRDSQCAHGLNETMAHLSAKLRLFEHFESRGLAVRTEADLSHLGIRRRADLLVEIPGGSLVAIEIQHTPILPEELEQRTRDYLGTGIAVLWLPLTTLSKQAIHWSGSTGVVERYAARSHEKWIHDYHRRQLWYYDTATEKLWLGRLDKCMLSREVRALEPWAGRYVSVATRRVRSKRWQKLTLRGPLELGEIALTAIPAIPLCMFSFMLPRRPVAGLRRI